MYLKILANIAVAFAAIVVAATVQAADVVDLERYQPKVVVEEAPYVIRGWAIDASLVKGDMPAFQPLVPVFSGDGRLFASWRPQDEIGSHPTLIILHGGHGVGNTDIEMARWAVEKLHANVMILDSFWSRGIQENWKSNTQYGANMRMLDAIAAARFVKAQGSNPAKTFIVGGSQGGWAVLRTLTSSHPFSDEVHSLMAGGVALYPGCNQSSPRLFGNQEEDRPPLGGKYVLPVVILTGSADEATPIKDCDANKVFKAAAKWIHFDGGTHAWDSANNGVGKEPTEGKCSKAENVYNHFPMCYSREFTNRTRNEIASLVNGIL